MLTGPLRTAYTLIMRTKVGQGHPLSCGAQSIDVEHKTQTSSLDNATHKMNTFTCCVVFPAAPTNFIFNRRIVATQHRCSKYSTVQGFRREMVITQEFGRKIALLQRKDIHHIQYTFQLEYVCNSLVPISPCKLLFTGSSRSIIVTGNPAGQQKCCLQWNTQNTDYKNIAYIWIQTKKILLTIYQNIRFFKFLVYSQHEEGTHVADCYHWTHHLLHIMTKLSMNMFIETNIGKQIRRCLT